MLAVGLLGEVALAGAGWGAAGNLTAALLLHVREGLKTAATPSDECLSAEGLKGRCKNALMTPPMTEKSLSVMREK